MGLLRLVALMGLALAGEPAKYLIVSAPKGSRVSYIKIVPGGSSLRPEPVPLIDSGLKSPQGIAVDLKTNTLYVADPDVRKILSYVLTFANGILMVESGPAVAAQNVEARWVAVDGVGNLFFTDELTNVIQKVDAASLHAGKTEPKMVYDGATINSVNRPGGVAVDNFHVFWTNKAIGTSVGSVVKGMEEPEKGLEQSALEVSEIAKNSNKAYGVCLSQNNVYYTNSEKFVYGVKKNGGAIATVSDQFVAPRGCAWDGDGTVFVADKLRNGVYSFPGNMHVLAPAQVTKVAAYEDAFGLAVISGPTSSAVSLLLAAYALF